MKNHPNLKTTWIFLLVPLFGVSPFAHSQGMLSGQVRDATGNPLTNAFLQAQDPVTFTTYYANSNATGEYQFNSMAPGDFLVRASQPGFQGAYQDGSTYPEENPATVNVADGSSVTGIDIVLPDGGSISGNITDSSTGLAVQNVYVSLSTFNSPSIWWDLSAYTDASGDYLIEGVPDRDDLVASANLFGYVNAYYDGALDFYTADLLSISMGSNLTGIDFQLHPGGILRAAVFTPSGLPVSVPGVPQILDPNIREIEKDSNGDLWFATDSGVMSIVDSATRAHHPSNSNLPGEHVRSLSTISSVTRYYATDNGIARHFGTDMIEAFTTGNSNLPYDDCSDIEAVSASAIYIGSPTGDFTRWDGMTGFTNTLFSDRGEPFSSPITSLAHDSSAGDILIGTSYGMTIFDIGTSSFSRFTSVDGLPSDQVTDLAVAQDGTQWIGTAFGIYVRYPIDPPLLLDTVDGLPSNYINDIHIASVTQVWIATTGGIAHYDNGAITAFTTGNSNLYTNTCYSIVERDGDIFIGSNSGLDILSGSTFRHIDRQNQFVSLYAYDPETGFGYNSGSSNSIPINLFDMPTGDYTLTASTSGYPSLYYDGVLYQDDATLIHVEEGMETPQRYAIEMEPYGGVIGSVTDPMGAPAVSGTVLFYPVGQSSNYTSTNVSGGNFQSTSLAPGDYYVAYSGGGYPVTFHPGVFALSDAMVVHIETGQTTSGIGIAIPNSVEGSISGQALDSLANPYPFVSVYLSGVFSTNLFRSTSTDKNGNYTLPSIPPGNYRVSMSPPALPDVYYSSTFEQTLFQPVGVDSGEAVTGVDLIVPTFSPGTIFGVVEDQEGDKIAGARVTLVGDFEYPSLNTDTDGQFQFSSLPPFSNYSVAATKDGHTPNAQYNITLASGANVGPVTLTLTEYPTTSVSGQVLDASGNPLSYLYLYYTHTVENLSLFLQTDWEGRYFLPDFPPGTSDVSLSYNGYMGLNQSVQLSPGLNVKDFVLVIDPLYGTLSGTVTDANAVPCAGLQVKLSGPSTTFVRTGKTGRYVASGLPPGTYTVEMDDFATHSTPLLAVELAAGLIRHDLDLEIDKVLAFITGTVTAEGGSPVAYPSPYLDNFAGFYNYNDQYGAYAICGLEPPMAVRVISSESGYRDQYYNGKTSIQNADIVSIAGSGETPDIDFNLTVGDRIEGTVRDIYGRPLTNASAYARSILTSNSRSGSTNSLGQYRVTGLHPGDYTVSSSVSNYYTEFYDDKPLESSADIVPLASGIPTTGIDFEVGNGGLISGKVVDTSGTPYSSGTVYAYLASDLQSTARTTNVNASGEYTLTVLRPGNYYIQAQTSSLPRVFYPSAFSTLTAQTVAVSEGSEIGGIDIAVPASPETASVSGTVTAPDGSPLIGQSVSIRGVDGYTGSYGTSTDSDGHYERTGIPPGTYVAVLSEANTPLFYYPGTYDPATAQRIVINPGLAISGIDIQTIDKQLATLSGTVRDQLNNPIADAEMSLTGDSTSYSATTLSNGTYSLSGIFPQSGYSLSVFKPGYFPAQEDDLLIPPNGSVTRDIILTSFQSGAVAGKVQDLSGYPIDQVFISIAGTDVNYQLSTQSDSFGDYVLDPLPPGNYNLTFSLFPYQDALIPSVQVVAGNTTTQNAVLLDFGGNGSISGTIYDASGHPTPGIVVQVSSPTYRQVVSQMDGTYRLNALSPGSYAVELPFETAKSAKGLSTVIADQDVPGVDFNLATTYGTIRGHIQNREGAPLFGALVEASPSNHSHYPSDVTSATSGLYIITRVLNEGGKDYFLSASLDPYVTTYYEDTPDADFAQIVRLQEGLSLEDIDITLGFGSTLRGTVTDGETGHPISSGNVYFYTDDLFYSASIGSGGIYQIRTLPPGTYTCYTSISGYSTEYFEESQYEKGATPLTIPEASVVEGIDFTPTKAASIAGMVLDDSGTPYNSGSVRAYDINRSLNDYFSANISSGMYTISNIPSGTYYVYAAISGKPAVFHPSSFSLSLAQMVTIEPGETASGIDITVPLNVENGSISGTLLDRFGNVDTDILAFVRGTDGTTFSQHYNLDAAGHYTSGDLLPGTYLVALSEDERADYYFGGTYNRLNATKVLVDSGSNVTGIDIMAIEQPQATLQGVVRDQADNPLQGVSLSLSGNSLSYSDNSSLADGSYRFKNIFPDESYTLTAQHPGFFVETLEGIGLVESQTTVVNISLTSFEETNIHGNISSASGYALPGCTVYVYGGNPSVEVYVSTDLLGNYRIDQLPAGIYSIQISRTGYVTETLTGIPTEPGVPVIRNVVLDFDSQYGLVSGAVMDSLGHPAYGVLVRSDSFQSTWTELDGTYRLGGLSAGTYAISLPEESESGNPSHESVVVEAGKTTSGIDFVLQVAYGTIAGVVRDDQLQPVHEAQIDTLPSNHNYYPPTTYSGFDGTYVVPRVRTDPARSYTVSADKAGFVRTYFGNTTTLSDADIIELDPGESFAPAPIRLVMGAQIAGNVHEEGTGIPIGSGSIVADNGTDSFSVSIQDAGNYEFDFLPPGDYRLYTSISSFVPEHYLESYYEEEAVPVTLDIGSRVEGIDFTPVRGGAISGMVQDVTGDPISSGTVYAYPTDRNFGDARSTNLNASGEYHVSNLAPGQYAVLAIVSGFPVTYYGDVFFPDDSDPVMVAAANETQGINITLPGTFFPGSISGRVRNLFGEPYGFVSLTIAGIDGTSGSYFPQTDEMGRYRVDDLPVGTYTVALRESGRPTYYHGNTFDRPDATRVEVGPEEEVTGIDINAPDRNDGSVFGMVRDSMGDPVNNAFLTLTDFTNYYYDSTGPDGAFSFPLVFPGSYNLEGVRLGFLPGELDLNVAENQIVRGLVLTLDSTTLGSIAGVVADASGNPLEDVSVDLYHDIQGYITSTGTSRYGEYFQTLLPTGTYTVYFSLSGFQTEVVEGLQIQNGLETLRSIELEPNTTTGRVAGRVLDANGRPAYRIRVRSEGPSNRTAYTLADGTYVLANLSQGDYRIYLPDETGPVVERLNVQVVNGTVVEGMDFSLDQAYGTILGGVFEKGTSIPIRSGLVEAEVFGTGTFIDTADTNYAGLYRIGRVPAGATGGARVSASGDGYGFSYWIDSAVHGGADPVALDAMGDATGIEFGLEPEAILQGRLTDTFGNPIVGANARATILEPSGSSSFSDSTNLDGWYQIENLAEGNYHLRFTANDFQTEYHNDTPEEASAEVIAVSAGSTETIDAVLVPLGAISGRVTDASGNPIPNAFVDLYRSGVDSIVRTFVDNAGNYSLQGVSSDDYRLRAFAGGYFPQWWLLQGLAVTSDVLTQSNETLTEGIDFVLFAASEDQIDFFQDGFIDAKDLLALLKQGSSSSGELFVFSVFWMGSQTKILTHSKDPVSP